LRLPFSSPPTTRRVTVEVFDPASTRGSCNLSFHSVICLKIASTNLCKCYQDDEIKEDAIGRVFSTHVN
jgi:hypothetical protein